jgi:pseudaminic acid biosynthesis-associated methylase
MTRQLDVWQGKFGKDYTERNAVNWRVRLPAFRAMLDGLKLTRLLEVGCNRGHNLVALRALLGDAVELSGVEPNPHALGLARGTGAAECHAGHILDLPFADGSFDLVFTAGVLIHVPPENLTAALEELHRCSCRYLLAAEYAAAEETAVPYRGHTDLLWKRDFLQEYQGRFPDLSLVRQGYWGSEHGFDRTTWWLLEKPVAAARQSA